jgi:MFS superfamily sulfate permease-like transporter
LQVAYFPRTVLTGAIGAIGVSLFIFGLQLSLPPLSDPLTLKSARLLLFDHSRLGIFVASVLPAVLLFLSIHLSPFERLSRGATQHALYIPVYLLFTAAIFWITVAALGHANEAGMKMLAHRGWLFAIDESTQSQHGIGRAWMYWTLFDLNNIQWHAMKGSIADLLLLVLIGVVSLPLYVPMLSSALDVPSYNMDREFLVHAVSNILSGIVGTLPNLIVCATSPTMRASRF